jgi:hypothetical protein
LEVYAIGVVQNEEDVVRESVAWASRFCRRIWVWDLGSTDRTSQILSQLASEHACVARTSDLPYSKTVRGALLGEIRAQMPEGAWLYKLDADEFVVGDPRPILEAAEREGAESVHGWHLDFYPTLDDIAELRATGEADWERLPLFERIRHYRVGWAEWRFAKLAPGFVWDVSSGRNKLRKAGGAKLERSRHHVLIRHYRYRSPSQVARRYTTRSASRAGGHGGFHYDHTADFARYALPAKQLRRWSDDDAPPRIPRRLLLRRHLKRYRPRKVIRKAAYLAGFTRRGLPSSD